MADELAVVDQTSQEAAPAQQDTDTGMEGQQDGQAAQPELGALQQQIENMNRELGQFRRAQSMLDKVPSMVEERLTKWQKAQQLNQLPPEERQAREQQEQQEKALREFTRKEAVEAFKEAAKGYLPVIEQWQRTQEQQAFYSEFRELAGEQAEELDEAAKSIFSRVEKDLDSGNEIKIEAAIKFMERAKAGGPEFVLFHAQRELSKQQKANADGLVQSRVQNGKAAAQQPKGKSGAANGAPRKRLDKMSEQEREAFIMEVGNERYAEALKADMAAAGIRS